MSKSKLRTEYETRFGVVDGYFKLYDDNNNVVYYEASDGYWAKYKFDDNNNVIYCETSDDGVFIDKRACSNKVFIDEQTGKKFKMVEVTDD